MALGQGVLPSSSSQDGSDWPFYCAEEPNSPDNVVTFYDTEGRKHGRAMNDGRVEMGHGIQVRVRAGTHESGYTKANAIAIAMDELYQDDVTISGTTYIVYNITRVGDVLPNGKEPTTSRRVFTINVLATILDRARV